MPRLIEAKSLLVLGADLEFAAEICRDLAADGALLLLHGGERAALEELDATLAQSELHHFQACPVGQLLTWLQELGARPDAVVCCLPATPEPPEGGLSALLPQLPTQLPAGAKLVLVQAERPALKAQPGLQPAARPLAWRHAALFEACKVLPLRVSALHAHAVVSARMLAELEPEARSATCDVTAWLTQHYQVGTPALRAEHLGPLVRTLLSSFSDYAPPQVYVFDGTR